MPDMTNFMLFLAHKDHAKKFRLKSFFIFDIC